MTEQEEKARDKASFYDVLWEGVGVVIVLALAACISVAAVVGAIKFIGWVL